LGLRGKGIGFAGRPVVPAVPRPRGPLDRLATSAAVGLKTAQGSSRGSPCEIWDQQHPTAFWWAHSSAESPARCAFWREGLVATLKVAQAELPPRNAEERLIPSLPFGCPASFASNRPRAARAKGVGYKITSVRRFHTRDLQRASRAAHLPQRGPVSSPPSHGCRNPCASAE
jgi:hypothetical protein